MSDAAPLFIRRLPLITGVFCLLGALVLLEALIRFGWVNRFVIPLPSEIAGSFGRLLQEEELLPRLFETLREAAFACFLVVAIGVPVGVGLYKAPLLRRAVEDGVAAFASAPLVLAFPLFLVLFGRKPQTVIVMAILHGVAPVILKTMEGLSATRPALINVGRSLKATPSQAFWKILLPSALPVIFTGIRLGWTFTLITVVAVEFLINLGGLGQLVNELAERFDLPGAYASICVVVLVSIAFFFGLERVELWLRPRR